MSNTVQLSAKTVQILANFAAINSSILFKKGNVIKTISNAQNILAKAVVDETFPQDFAIYDLSQFLSAISLFNDPVLIFDNENYVTIRDSTVVVARSITSAILRSRCAILQIVRSSSLVVTSTLKLAMPILEIL